MTVNDLNSDLLQGILMVSLSRRQPLSLADVGVYLLVAQDATILNLSQGGMAVETVHPLIIRKAYRFCINAGSSTVILDGEVVRCNLVEVTENEAGDSVPMYHNGIQFLIERNPIEISLLEIMQANLAGEKRMASQRVVPLHNLKADIGHTCMSRLVQFSGDGLVFESDALWDMDQNWPLMIQVGSTSLTVSGRVVNASKRSDHASYSSRIEFLDLSPDEMTYLEKVKEDLTD